VLEALPASQDHIRYSQPNRRQPREGIADNCTAWLSRSTKIDLMSVFCTWPIFPRVRDKIRFARIACVQREEKQFHVTGEVRKWIIILPACARSSKHDQGTADDQPAETGLWDSWPKGGKPDTWAAKLPTNHQREAGRREAHCKKYKKDATQLSAACSPASA
jgi:hypothetical protein